MGLLTLLAAAAIFVGLREQSTSSSSTLIAEEQCGVLTASEAEQLLGGPVGLAPSPAHDPAECEYQSAVDDARVGVSNFSARSEVSFFASAIARRAKVCGFVGSEQCTPPNEQYTTREGSVVLLILFHNAASAITVRNGHVLWARASGLKNSNSVALSALGVALSHL